jgi:2-polyprenyl-6-methoxyphenol hydroxylase-like FAD-dependent oxidoreductase
MDIIIIGGGIGGLTLARAVHAAGAARHLISQDELPAIFERYQKLAGYHGQQAGQSQG